MKNYILILIITLSSVFYLKGQQYAVSKIKPELLNNSNVVIREQVEEFTVVSEKETRFKAKIAVTLLNESAPDTYGYVLLPYDKFSKVDKIKATIYDEKGEQVIKMKSSDLLDMSAVSSFSIFEDNRIKAYNPSYKRYPYTLEYEYQYTFNGSLFYPKWDPQSETGVAVEHASFKVISPAHIPFRYKQLNTSKPDTSIVDNQKIYVWSATNLPSVEYEMFAPLLGYTLPQVLTAPVNFTYDNHPGNMSSWNSFSNWIIGLNKGRDQLDPQTEADLQKLILPTDDQHTKVRKVYSYLQSRTRYVSIQLGIGGFQPFPASVVGEKGYGDCKALSNYTKAMLKRLGIESHYTLVKAGEGELDVFEDFPSSQFNHAFLCVPLKSDTIWLECTSQTNPFGFLGKFTGDRNVLIVTENGGKIVRTPTLKASENVQLRKAIVNISDAGDASLSVSTDFKGLQFENDYINFLIHQSKEDQKKYLYEKLALSNFTINNFSYKVINDKIPTATESLDISVKGFTAKNGKRMFFQPNLLNKLKVSIPNYESRRSDIVIDMPFTDIDTVEYNLTAKYFVEHVPADIEIKGEFGEYKTQFVPSDGRLIYIRKFTLNSGTYPKEKYKEFSEFMRKVKLADNVKLAVVDKT